MADVSTVIFEELKKDIIHLVIKPGEKIGEGDICNRFSVSRPPVRAAFNRLQDIGLLDVVPYRGACATLLNLDEICQILFSRITLETQVILDYMDTNPTPLEIEDLDHNIRKQQITIANDVVDSQEFYRLDSELHEFWFRRMNCLYLWNRIQSDMGYQRFRMLDFIGTLKYSEIVESHVDIVEAIRRNDRKMLPGIVAKHLIAGLKRMRHVSDEEFRQYFNDPDDLSYWKTYFDSIAAK